MIRPDETDPRALNGELCQALERMIAAELSGIGSEICKARHHARDILAKARGEQ
jgi:hypothetical protein